MESVTYRYVGRAEYGAVWEMQKRLFDELLEAKKAGIGAGQTLLMVEHPHVYTLGKSGHESNMLVSDEFLRSIGRATSIPTGAGTSPITDTVSWSAIRFWTSSVSD